MAFEVRPLTAAEFEQYVAGLIRALEFAKSGTIHTNKRYEGVRQPGAYEIDVALEVQLAPPLKFTLIVECKNWKRPVGRPTVQKLAQTRDAIGADKAAIASPVGFTKQAIEVASVLGVALWVVTLREWIVEYNNGAIGLSLQALDEDWSRDWVQEPARIGLVAWYGNFATFPAETPLPQHLKWARFPDLYYRDARLEVTNLMATTLLCIDERALHFRPRRVYRIG